MPGCRSHSCKLLLMHAAKALAITFLISVSAPCQGPRLAVGLTSTGALIEAVEVRGASAKLPFVIHIGGLDGRASEGVLRHIEAVRSKPAQRRDYHLIAIPHANPMGVKLAFPPTGV